MSNYPTLLPVPVTSESATVCVLSEPQAINLSNNATYFSTISTTTILQSKAQFREFPLKKNHKFQKFLDRSDHRNFKKKFKMLDNAQPPQDIILRSRASQKKIMFRITRERI